MKHIDEYRNSRHIAGLAEAIRQEAIREYTFMEVCGGHTAAIHRFGIPSLLPLHVRLLSGPGCPVCVTPSGYIDTIMALSSDRSVVMTLFGDLMRVPGTHGSPAEAKASGADIRVVLSADEALGLAVSNPGRKIIFAAIGFETTAPGTAVTVMKAEREGISNFFVLGAHKVMPPAMEMIIRDGTAVDGFICPGHVAVITGSSAFEFIAGKYRRACAVAGFEPADILMAVLMLIRQVNSGTPRVEIQYRRAVSREGNIRAQGFMGEVFEPCDSEWRGLGIIPSGGLGLRERFRRFDAGVMCHVTVPEASAAEGCICGDILRGVKIPTDCPLFDNACRPEHPHGACMVSDEGSCNTYYKYNTHG
jgi:hydrogenase expression/formation protein HypD